MTGPAALAVDGVVARGGFRLEVAVEAAPGEVLAVLGPNGAGKTTLLRAAAGLAPLTAGSLRLGECAFDDVAAGVFVPPQRRPVGLVFQDYRLFPHLDVLDTVAFAPRARAARRRAARQAAREWLERLDLLPLAARHPRELSGGQAQRVALARALAARPALLLLDEPLAALDASGRLEVRGALRRHLAGFAGPSLLVTHDPVEALVLADRLLVVEAGRVVQRGAPAEVARRPATEWVARLVGLNLYAGAPRPGRPAEVVLDAGGVLRAAGPVPGDRVLVALPPAAVAVHASRPGAGSARNAWPGRVRGLELVGDRVRLDVEGEPSALVDVTPAAVAELGLRPGRDVWLSAKATELEVYPEPASPG